MEVRDSAQAVASNNQFYGNRELGLNNSTANMIDATQGWWSEVDGSGPYHPTTNPAGTGEEISDNVNSIKAESEQKSINDQTMAVHAKK